jgi:tetratricopeptide (TPR) repeat protein
MALARNDAIATTRVELWPVAERSPVPPRLKGEQVLTADVNLSPMSGEMMTAETAFVEARQAVDDGRWEAAVQRYQQAITLNPTLLEARNNLGHLYVRLNRVVEAIAEFRAALALAPGYAIARNNLGSAYLMAGQEHLAIQEFLEAVRLDGTYVTPYYNLASVYARRGDTEPAMIFLTKALAMDPAVLSWVDEDVDFAGVRDSPQFQRLRSVRTAQW